MSTVQLIPRLYKATRDNVLGEDLSDYITKGKVTFNPDRTIKWDCAIESRDPDIVKPYSEYLAPFLTVRHGDGLEETSQLGLYAVVPPAQTISMQKRTATLDGRDLTWLLASDVYENGYTVNGVVTSAITSIINSVGITRISVVPSTQTTVQTWKAGTTKLQVVNDLLNGIGYYTLFSSKDGRLTSRPYQSTATQSIGANYDTTDPNSRVKVLRTIRRDSTAADRIANKIVVIKDNANDAPLVATAINSNPLSPTSTVALGMTIAKLVNDSNVTDQATAENMAQRQLEEASQLYERVTITTTPDVNREPFEQYNLNIIDADGESVVHGVWNCRGWTIGFTPADGYMTHDLSNITNPPMNI